MAKNFIDGDFLLQSATAKRLYHDHAEKMPVFDYHCHVPAAQIAADHNFENLTRAWLAGDHYKWRAMRANGVDEMYITGSADDFEKFYKWAETVPYTVRNPLYHWTALELKRFFGIDEPLNADSARTIYDTCGEMLRSNEFTVRNLMRKMNVQFVCTTEQPQDPLEHHKKIRADKLEIEVSTAFRADSAMAGADTTGLNSFISGLEKACGTDIADYAGYINALKKRHGYFAENGCSLSDYGIERAFAEDYTAREIEFFFQKIKSKEKLRRSDRLKFNSAVMADLAEMHADNGWVMQLHLGAVRSVNTKMLSKLGPDTGYDSIGDFEQARPLAKFLDRLESRDKLPKTILYNLNPADNAVFAAIAGCFQDGRIPGKIQWGAAWWFLDQKRGIEQHLNTLSEMGLLSRFVGMLTDSRSFLSYPRHEYFRRILCNILGNDVEAGLLPGDIGLLGTIVEDICFKNAKRYFQQPRPNPAG